MMDVLNATWPPAYTITQSKRSKRIYLKICRRHGLRVIVPRRFNQKEIPQLIEKSKEWIERIWMKAQPVAVTLPKELNLLAINQHWHITYEAEDMSKQALIFLALKKWLKQQAQLHLTARLDELCKTTGLSYTALHIGNASTRWGSCSLKKKISLSLKLLFLPIELVDYVLLHELCHTVHLNHSKSFWALLNCFSPNHEALRKRLRQYSELTPAWL